MTGNMTAREVGREPTPETMEGDEVARWRGDALRCGGREGNAPEVYALLSCCVPHRVRVAERDDGAAGSNMADGACGAVSGASRAEAGGGYRSYVPR